MEVVLRADAQLVPEPGPVKVVKQMRSTNTSVAQLPLAPLVNLAMQTTLEGQGAAAFPHAKLQLIAERGLTTGTPQPLQPGVLVTQAGAQPPEAAAAGVGVITELTMGIKIAALTRPLTTSRRLVLGIGEESSFFSSKILTAWSTCSLPPSKVEEAWATVV